MIAAEHARDQAALRLGILHALRIAVPACLDDQAGRAYARFEEQLLEQINGAPAAGT